MSPLYQRSFDCTVKATCMPSSYKDSHQVQHNQVYHGCCPSKRPLVQPNKDPIKLVCTPHYQPVVEGCWSTTH